MINKQELTIVAYVVGVLLLALVVSYLAGPDNNLQEKCAEVDGVIMIQNRHYQCFKIVKVKLSEYAE